jgi:hypothetical protein
MEVTLTTCEHRFGNGRACKGLAIRGENFCRHHLRYKDQRDITSPDYEMPDLEDGDSVQLLVNEALRALVSGKMETNRGKTILWGALIASSNLKRAQLGRFDDNPSRIKGQTEFEWVKYVCEERITTAIGMMRPYIIGSGRDAGRTIGEVFDRIVSQVSPHICDNSKGHD